MIDFKHWYDKNIKELEPTIHWTNLETSKTMNYSKREALSISQNFSSPYFKYRYYYSKSWGDKTNILTFIMFNPSTADINNDDATIKNCIKIAYHSGFEGIEVVNLFSLRSPNVSYLNKIAQIDEIQNDENKAYLEKVLANSKNIVFAWGSHALTCKKKNIMDNRKEKAIGLSINQNNNLYCISINKNNSPAHPGPQSFNKIHKSFCKRGLISLDKQALKLGIFKPV